MKIFTTYSEEQFRNYILTSLFILTAHIFAFGQGKVHGGTSLDSQQTVIAFGDDNYTRITGTLIISGNDITDLSRLSSLNLIDGDLLIQNNFELTTLDGLDAITSVGGNLLIYNNRKLVNLEALDALTSVGGNLNVNENMSITNLEGLHTISSVGGYLWITENPSITNLEGLRTITSVTGSLWINNNSMLISFCGIRPLLDAGFSGSYIVSGNGYNPIKEQINSNTCTLSINPFFSETFNLYPNPVKEGVLRLRGPENQEYKATVMDSFGNVLIQSVVSSEKSIDISNLAKGTYFVEIRYNNHSIVKKVIR